VQWAGLAAWNYDISDRVAEYKGKRDFMKQELENDFEIHGANGAFYLFLKAPWGTGTEFVTEGVKENLLVIPGNVFSDVDTHFRISYAATDETLQRGVEILRKLARR
jgi:aspartate aminotransferase/aminotransferase